VDDQRSTRVRAGRGCRGHQEEQEQGRDHRSGHRKPPVSEPAEPRPPAADSGDGRPPVRGALDRDPGTRSEACDRPRRSPAAGTVGPRLREPLLHPTPLGPPRGRVRSKYKGTLKVAQSARSGGIGRRPSLSSSWLRQTCPAALRCSADEERGNCIGPAPPGGGDTHEAVVSGGCRTRPFGSGPGRVRVRRRGPGLGRLPGGDESRDGRRSHDAAGALRRHGRRVARLPCASSLAGPRPHLVPRTGSAAHASRLRPDPLAPPPPRGPAVLRRPRGHAREGPGRKVRARPDRLSLRGVVRHEGRCERSGVPPKARLEAHVGHGKPLLPLSASPAPWRVETPAGRGIRNSERRRSGRA